MSVPVLADKRYLNPQDFCRFAIIMVATSIQLANFVWNESVLTKETLNVCLVGLF